MPLAVELALLSRHGQSKLNVSGLVNGDPTRDLGLSGVGIEEAEGLARQIDGVAIDLCVTSIFPRAMETAELALGGRAVPRVVDPELNDIQVGELEGKTLDDYRVWKHAHTRDDPFPGGESLNAAARRYADAFERVLARPEAAVLVVCHEIPVRYAVNAAAGSDDLDRPLHKVANAQPYLFDAAGLRRAVDQIRRLAAPEHVERP
jgi:ribonuclease H / adenosylcobalamin/alpha-ribazole phosphatase